MHVSSAHRPETPVHRSTGKNGRPRFAFDIQLFARWRHFLVSKYSVNGNDRKLNSTYYIVCRGILATLFVMLLTLAANGQTVRVENVPPGANQIAVTVDQGPSTWVAGVFSLPTSGAQEFSLQLAKGDNYRLRAVAYTSGSKFPLVSAIGRIPSFSVSDNDSELTLSLSPPDIHITKLNLTGNGPRALVEITCTVEMFSDFWSANHVFWLWLSDKPFRADGAARHIIATGGTADDGSVSAKFVVPDSLTSGKNHYQCGYPLTQFGPAFATPALIWPTVRHKADRYQLQGPLPADDSGC